MFEKRVIVREVSIGGVFIVMVLYVHQVLEDGAVIAERYVRESISPGDDYSTKDPMVQAVCAAVHTPEAIAAYQAITNPPTEEGNNGN